MKTCNPANTLCILVLALLGLVYGIDLVRAAPPPPGAPRDQAERDLRDSYEAERAEHQAAGNPIGQQGALVQRRVMDLEISLREFRRMVDAELSARGVEPRTGRLYTHEQLALAGDDAAHYQYLSPGAIVAELTRARREVMVEADGPAAPMRALVAARGMPEYQGNLAALVERAQAAGQILLWDVEPIPNGRDWSDEDRKAWVTGYGLLMDDVDAIDPAAPQLLFRVPHFSPERETRVILARNGVAGGKLAEQAGRFQAYWSTQDLLAQEEQLYSAYQRNREHFRDLADTQDFAGVVAYQVDRYPAVLWAPAEFARAHATGKPLVVFLSPKIGGSSSGDWVDLDELAFLLQLVELYDASVLWWINSADLGDTSHEMAARYGLVVDAMREDR